MMLIIQTQHMENYAWNEDGSIGTGPNAYWKSKGGSSFKVKNIPLNIDYQTVVDMLKPQLEYSNDYAQSEMLGWFIENDDYLSAFEQSQLDYEGVIIYDEPSVDYDEFMEAA